MKKLLLTLGASAAALAPVMTLVACGGKKEAEKKATDSFKLEKGVYDSENTTLDFKIDTDAKAIEAFKAIDVSTVLDSVTTDLIKAIEGIVAGAAELSATKISFSKTIDFKENKGVLGEAKTITLTDIKGNYNTLTDIKEAFSGASAKSVKSEFAGKIIDNLYVSSTDTDGAGFKMGTPTFETPKLTFDIITDEILLNLIKTSDFSDIIIDIIVNEIYAKLSTGSEASWGGGNVIEFGKKFEFNATDKRLEATSSTDIIKVEELAKSFVTEGSEVNTFGLLKTALGSATQDLQDEVKASIKSAIEKK